MKYCLLTQINDMKKIIYLSILCLLGFSCTQIQNNGYLIKGKINGINASKIYLKKYVGSGYLVTDSTTSLNSEFSFSGKVDFPEIFRIVVEDIDDYIPVFIENKEITIVADTAQLGKAKIIGSLSDKFFKKLMSDIDSIDALSQPIYDSIDLVTKRNDWAKVDELEVKLEGISAKENEAMENFVKENPSLSVSVYVLYKYLTAELDLKNIEILKESLDSTLHKSIYYELLLDQIEILKKTDIGHPAPDFTLLNNKGDSIRLSSLFGKYLLIDFWASWCSPCRKENPNVVKAYKNFASKGFNVLGVSLDTKYENWVKAIKDDHLSWNHVSDLKGWGNKVAQLYGVRSIPSNFLLDQKGIIIAKNLRGKELQKKLKEILK